MLPSGAQMCNPMPNEAKRYARAPKPHFRHPKK